MDILTETKISCWLLAFTLGGFIALPFIGNTELKGPYTPPSPLEEQIDWTLAK